MKELSTALVSFEKDRTISAVVITGSEKAFAAGADIKEMAPNTYSQCILGNFLNDWTKVAQCQKPIIAAVNGYAVKTHPQMLSSLKKNINFWFKYL